uniref:Uncharacterized protein n=1 Tax=Panagrolaimus sp. JU765 TaxID=591449 RepID=A0AC34QZN4_9BILA
MFCLNFLFLLNLFFVIFATPNCTKVVIFSLENSTNYVDASDFEQQKQTVISLINASGEGDEKIPSGGSTAYSFATPIACSVSSSFFNVISFLDNYLDDVFTKGFPCQPQISTKSTLDNYIMNELNVVYYQRSNGKPILPQFKRYFVIFTYATEETDFANAGISSRLLMPDAKMIPVGMRPGLQSGIIQNFSNDSILFSNSTTVANQILAELRC